jgi:hypothetical protein
MLKYKHMLFDKFLGGISSKDAHSNQYAAGTASEQTFSERKQVEQNRNLVAGYQQSKIGHSFVSREGSVRSTPRPYARPERKVTRQGMNARPQAVRQLPTRGYDPYA